MVRDRSALLFQAPPTAGPGRNFGLRGVIDATSTDRHCWIDCKQNVCSVLSRAARCCLLFQQRTHTINVPHVDVSPPPHTQSTRRGQGNGGTVAPLDDQMDHWRVRFARATVPSHCQRTPAPPSGRGPTNCNGDSAVVQIGHGNNEDRELRVTRLRSYSCQEYSGWPTWTVAVLARR
jgi:hypothetical protein